MAEPKPRRFRRWLRRLVLAGLAGGLVLIAWLLLLPVPIGWAVNWATRRAVPPGQGLTLGVRAATFRWHLGAGELDLTMEDPTAVATDGRPVAKVSQIRLVFNKAALFGHHWLPAKVEVTQPVLTLDFKGSGWPSRAMAASAAKPVAVVPGRIEATALQPWLPAEGVPFALEVSGLAVELRAPERTVTWHFQPIETTLTREGENLALALALRLEGGSKPVGLKGHVEGKLSAHTLHFSATVPSFGTDDLPPLPLDPLALPPARLRGLAFDVDGTVDLDRVALPDLHFHLLAEDGELNLPRIKAGGPILLHRFEAAGYAADNAKTIAFDLLALELDSLHLTATKTRLVTGAAPALQADIALTGPDGSDVVAWLPAATAQALPFPASGLREVGITRLETHLEASLTSSDLVGASLQTLSLSGQLTLALGGHPVPFSFNAALPASGGPVIARLELAGVRLAALGDLALLKGYAPARAFDLPVRVSAELTATPHGEWRTARVTLTTTEPGTLRAFGPLVRDVPVKSFALVAETPDAGHSIRVGTLALDLDGPKLSVENLAVKLAPAASDPIELEGNIAAEQFPGAFLASFLPKDQLASLTPYGVTPADLQLDRVTGGFTARLVPGDRPAAATFKGEVTAHFQSQPLALGLEAALAGPDLSATLDLARVNPARFHLQLPGSLPLAAIDVPVQVQTRLTADTTGRLKTVTVHAEGGPGLFHATEQIFNADVPVTAFKIDVTADGAFQHLRLNSLAMDLDGVGVTAGPAALDPGVAGGAPLQVSGTVALAHLTVGHLLQWWPADLQPGLRGQIAPFVQSGELTRAAFTFAAPFDPTHPESTRPTALTGGAQFGNLHATPGQAPGPVTVQEVTVSVSWPGANVTVMNFAAPGVTVPAATVSLSALDQREPQAGIQADFTADFTQVSAWLTVNHQALPSGVPLDLGRLTGRARGSFTASMPLAAGSFDPALVRGEFTANISGLAVPLTMSGYELGEGELGLVATANAGAYGGSLDWKNFHLAVPGAIGGRASLTLQAAGSPAADEFGVKLAFNATETRLLLAGVNAPPLSPIAAEAKVTGWLRQAKPQIGLSAQANDLLGAPFAVVARATLDRSRDSVRAERIEVSDFQLGRTALHADLQIPAPDRYEVSVGAARIDTPGLLVLLGPFMPLLSATVPGTATTARAVTAESTPRPSLKADIRLAETELGAGLAMHDFTLTTELRDGRLVAASLTGREGLANTLAFTLFPTGDHQAVALTVTDIPAWLQALTRPLQNAKLPPGTLANLVAQAAKVPVILKGGQLDLRGDLRPGEPAKLFEGKFSLRDTTMIQPPLLLQLIALKSRSSMQVNPLLKELSATRLYLNDTAVGAEGLAFTVSGLVNFLSLHTARYGLQDESVYTDGKYGVFEFEVKGKRPTLGLADVYLKENAVIRAIGTESELDFGDPEPPKKP